MLSAPAFARGASLLQAAWPQLCPGGPGPWDLAVRQTPFGEVRYLHMDAVPAEALGCNAANVQPGVRIPPKAPGPEEHEHATAGRLAGASRTLPGTPVLPAGAGMAELDMVLVEEDEAFAVCSSVLPQHRGPAGQLQPQQHLYDLHVVLHASYQVPTLLLRGLLPDGQLLTWQDMLKDFPRWTEHALAAGCDWAFMAPEVHPVLQQPGWYMLHPCQTCELMRLLLDPGHSRQKEQAQGQGQRPGCFTSPGGDWVQVPDIDDVPTPCHQQEQQQQQPWTAWMLHGDASDAVLLGYMESWCRLVGPVVGLGLRLPGLCPA